MSNPTPGGPLDTCPPAPGLRRERLLERLRTPARLTLVLAPAGCGKTTLLMQYCNEAASPIVKVAGQWVYLYRATDQFGQVIDILVSRHGISRLLAGFSPAV